MDDHIFGAGQGHKRTEYLETHLSGYRVALWRGCQKCATKV